MMITTDELEGQEMLPNYSNYSNQEGGHSQMLNTRN